MEPILVIILILFGVVILYYSGELNMARTSARAEYARNRELEQRILELRSKVPPEALSEREKCEMECEAEAQKLMEEYMKRDGAFS